MVEQTTARALRLPRDGWLTNNEAVDEKTRDMIRREYGPFRIGPPKPTKQRSLEELVKRGIVGIYLVQE